ncbi:MAG: 4Fe-4S binding protein [Candidatus Thorarchaeota archaeon]|jgi:polyferredoxin
MAKDSESSEDMDFEEEQSEPEEVSEDEISEPEVEPETPRRLSLKNPVGIIFNVRMLRRVVQILFFLGINAYILVSWIGGEQILAFWENVRDILPTLPIIAPLEAPTALLAGTFDTLQREFSGGIFPFFTLGAMIIIVTVLGRSACGWVCPIGTIQDFATLPKRSKVRPSPNTEKELRRIKTYIFVIVIGLAVWVGISRVFGTAGDFERILGVFASAAFDPFNPAFIIFYEATTQLWPYSLETLWFITQWGFFIGQLAFVVLIVAVGIWVPRWFCRWLCPAGWLYGVFSREALIGIGRNPARCTPDTCNVCEVVCPMNIRIRRYPYKALRSPECIMCLECKSHCPSGAIVLRFS